MWDILSFQKKEIYLINTFKNTTSGSIQGHKKAFHHEN